MARRGRRGGDDGLFGGAGWLAGSEARVPFVSFVRWLVHMDRALRPVAAGLDQIGRAHV